MDCNSVLFFKVSEFIAQCRERVRGCYPVIKRLHGIINQFWQQQRVWHAVKERGQPWNAPWEPFLLFPQGDGEPPGFPQRTSNPGCPSGRWEGHGWFKDLHICTSTHTEYTYTDMYTHKKYMHASMCVRVHACVYMNSISMKKWKC